MKLSQYLFSHLLNHLFLVYFTMLSVAENTSIRRQIVERLMNRKRCERKLPWTDLKYYIGICLEGVQDVTKTSVRGQQLLNWSRNSLRFMKPEVSLLCTQESATGTYP
jgi:hypothetical protein